ncbi:hypothetical protein BKA80DRAFT_3301 [Phyllosticta citrichinensis]
MRGHWHWHWRSTHDATSSTAQSPLRCARGGVFDVVLARAHGAPSIVSAVVCHHHHLACTCVATKVAEIPPSLASQYECLCCSAHHAQPISAAQAIRILCCSASPHPQTAKTVALCKPLGAVHMLPQHATLFLFMMLGPQSFLAISSTQAPSPCVLYPAVGRSARSSCPVHSTAPRYWHSLPRH